MSIQEKEHRILRLQEELKRLSLYETECKRKDDLIQTLREEIADLQVLYSVQNVKYENFRKLTSKI